MKFGPDVTVESDTVCASVCFKTLLHKRHLAFGVSAALKLPGIQK